MARPRKRPKEESSTPRTKAGREPLPPAPRVPTLEELFGGPRPASFSRGLEPAFLLIEKDVMELLRTRAAALGLGGYDSLAKRILREHVHEY
jgi:hypothetical protein